MKTDTTTAPKPRKPRAKPKPGRYAAIAVNATDGIVDGSAICNSQAEAWDRATNGQYPAGTIVVAVRVLGTKRVTLPPQQLVLAPIAGKAKEDANNDLSGRR